MNPTRGLPGTDSNTSVHVSETCKRVERADRPPHVAPGFSSGQSDGRRRSELFTPHEASVKNGFSHLPK